MLSSTKRKILREPSANFIPKLESGMKTLPVESKRNISLVLAKLLFLPTEKTLTSLAGRPSTSVFFPERGNPVLSGLSQIRGMSKAVWLTRPVLM